MKTLPHEKEPGEIWPWMIWEDVSKNYSGVFFRVVGGESASFGNIQQENIPRINRFVSFWRNYHSDEVYKNQVPGDQSIDIPMSGSSKWIATGGSASNSDYKYSHFESTGGEVRPKNMAIKVWRRIS